MSSRPSSSSVLAGVIAVVGCDGSGKSTLTADLHRHLAATGPTEFLYLGQGSGNIARRIRQLPLIGPALGALLKRRSERAHADDGKPAAPDLATAFVVYCLSRRRYAQFRRMLSLARSGVTVITDRYPQAEVPGFYFDGPGLSEDMTAGRAVRALAVREMRLYRDMASHIPALVIRLNIDAATAHRRKPDHKLSMLEDKVRVIPTLSFGGAPVLELDGQTPYPEVLAAAVAAIDRLAVSPLSRPGAVRQIAE